MKQCFFFFAVLAAFSVSLLCPPALFGQRSDQSIQDWQKESLRLPQGGKMDPGDFEEPPVARTETKEAFTEEAWNTYRDLDKKIYLLSRKIDNMGGNLKEEAGKAWDDVKARQAKARTQLDALAKAARDGWEKEKSKTNATLESLRKAYNRAFPYFR